MEFLLKLGMAQIFIVNIILYQIVVTHRILALNLWDALYSLLGMVAPVCMVIDPDPQVWLLVLVKVGADGLCLVSVIILPRLVEEE